MALWAIVWGILQKPSVVEMIGEAVMMMVPLWIAVVVGVLVGWAWKPKWANLLDVKASSSSSDESESSSSAVKSRGFGAIPSLNVLKMQLPSFISWSSDDGANKDDCALVPTTGSDISSSSEGGKDISSLLSSKDLGYLHKLVEEKDGGPAWIQMMDRSTKTMRYQAWRRDPENGPPQYRSRTVYEDATPEMVRDFFWDDEFRLKWDDMLIHAETIDKCPKTGTMIVQWVRKFPFFCSDREYVIGRRIWESGRTYYCVTKGVPCLSVPRQNKPRRVDLYYSSWCIRPIESRRGDGQLTACEVLLFHYEDMGIPWEIAKLGVRQGMWGAVKKIDPGLRAYQNERAAATPLTHCANMDQITTKVSEDYIKSLESTTASDSSEIEKKDSSCEKPSGRNLPKLVVVGGAIVLACSLDRGLLTKAVIFGVARRFAKIGRRL